jgi:GH25 family lysozyme M1 (1,4-beta-N-acetylmuramidase)
MTEQPNGELIDISLWQAVTSIDWSKLAENKIAAIIRGGQGAYDDPLFRVHFTNAKAAGAAAGMYWFFQPDAEVSYQVNAAIAAWKTVKPSVFALDVENITYTDTDGTRVNIFPPSAEIHTRRLKQFLSEFETETGVIPAIYTRADYWNVWTLRDTAWKHYPLWIASWTLYSSDVRMPLDWDEWKIWQYEGGTGRIDGVIGPVDRNKFRGTSSEMLDFFGVDEIEPPVELTIEERLTALEKRVAALEGK